MSHQQAFAEGLLAAHDACPPGLSAWNHSDPGRRFAIYRNNVMVSLIDALADTYPVTRTLVGEECFRGMAGRFARTNPPRSPVMAHYGAGFAEFVGGLPSTAALPYLADLARLEMLRVEAFHAADAAAVADDDIARLLGDPEHLPAARFTLHPSLRLLISPYAVASLWAAHQADDVDAALAMLDWTVAESALVMRTGLDVGIHRVSADAALFIGHLQEGFGLGIAAERAQAQEPAFDPTAALKLLLHGGALIRIDLPGTQQWRPAPPL
jgi:hypothetical protein